MLDNRDNNTPALVADIGGTNARFALSVNEQIVPDSIVTYACANFRNFDDAVVQYCEDQRVTVHEICAAFACPVGSDRVSMTNNHWDFSIKEVQQKLNLTTFKVINDFTAQALALPKFDQDSLLKIGGGREMAEATKLIIGPGTGLGVAALKKVGDDWLPLPGEGGHAAFSPITGLDNQILTILQREIGYVSWESVLCGSGLEQLYRAHAQLNGQKQELKDYEITQQALEGEPLSLETLRHFCQLIGRAASNAALTCGARGGVYIAGGIIPRFPEFFADSGFRSSFELNDKMAGYLAGIPTYLILSDNPGLIGAAAALHNPLA